MWKLGSHKRILRIPANARTDRFASQLWVVHIHRMYRSDFYFVCEQSENRYDLAVVRVPLEETTTHLKPHVN